MRINDSLRKLRKKRAENFLESNKEVIRMKFARDAMVKPVYLYPEDNAKKMIKKLKREDTNVCVVVTKEKKFVGEISVEDLIKLFLHQVEYEPLVQMLNIGYRRKFLHMSAKKLINKHRSTIGINEPINKVIKLIYKEGFNYIPVLDKNKKVVGVVTPSSLIDFLQNE